MRKMLMGAAAVLVLAATGASAETIRLDAGQLDLVTAGSSSHRANVNYNVHKYVNIRKYKNNHVRSNIYSHPRVKGNAAEAEAGASAYGRNTFTQTSSFSDVVQHRSSTSYSDSVAATKGSYYKRR